MDELGERWSERPPPIFYRQLHGDPSLDRYLIKVTRAGIIWVNVVILLALIDHGHSTLTLRGLIETNIFVYAVLIMVALAHLTVEVATVAIVVAHVEGAALGAFDKLMARFATYHWLGRQNRALVMHWCHVILAHGVRRVCSNLDIHVSKSSHHRVHVEVVRLGAAECGNLLHLLVLTLEEGLSFLPRLIMLERWALLVVTDVLFDHLFLCQCTVNVGLVTENEKGNAL